MIHSNWCCRMGSVTAAACAILIAFSFLSPAHAQERQSIRWATSNTGSYGYKVAASMGKVLERALGGKYVITVNPYPSTTGAMKAAMDGTAEVGYTADVGMRELYDRDGGFKGLQGGGSANIPPLDSAVLAPVLKIVPSEVSKPQPGVQLEFELSAAQVPDVRAEGNHLLIEFPKGSSEPVTTAEELSPPAEQTRAEVAVDQSPPIVLLEYEAATLRAEVMAGGVISGESARQALARLDIDELGLLMFRQLLDPARWHIELASAEMLSSEVVALVLVQTTLCGRRPIERVAPPAAAARRESSATAAAAAPFPQIAARPARA